MFPVPAALTEPCKPDSQGSPPPRGPGPSDLQRSPSTDHDDNEPRGRRRGQHCTAQHKPCSSTVGTAVHEGYDAGREPWSLPPWH